MGSPASSARSSHLQLDRIDRGYRWRIETACTAFERRETSSLDAGIVELSNWRNEAVLHV